MRLTTNGNLTGDDAGVLVPLVGTQDIVDPVSGAYRSQARSAAELPELALVSH